MRRVFSGENFWGKFFLMLFCRRCRVDDEWGRVDDEWVE